MITFKSKDFDYSGTKDRVEGACLSTDTKPTTGIANGSCLIEMDTGNRFMFDEANGEWLNITNPGGGGGAEVWLVGDTYEDVEGVREFTLSNSGDVDHMTELFTNSSNYEVYLNGELLPYVTTIVEPAGVSWCDTEMPEHATKRVDVLGESSVATEAYADYMDPSTAPTSVEVSVKAK